MTCHQWNNGREGKSFLYPSPWHPGYPAAAALSQSCQRSAHCTHSLLVIGLPHDITDIFMTSRTIVDKSREVLMKALNGSVCEPDMAQGQWTSCRSIPAWSTGRPGPRSWMFSAATDLVKMLLIIVFRPFTKEARRTGGACWSIVQQGWGQGWWPGLGPWKTLWGPCPPWWASQVTLAGGCWWPGFKKGDFLGFYPNFVLKLLLENENKLNVWVCMAKVFLVKIPVCNIFLYS